MRLERNNNRNDDAYEGQSRHGQFSNKKLKICQDQGNVNLSRLLTHPNLPSLLPISYWPDVR